MIAFWHVVLVFIVSLCYKSTQLGLPFASDEHVLLLTAHPDDETMFFAPTLLALHAEAEVYSLCLSNGGADGLGIVREKELNRSLDVFGIGSDRRTVLDHPKLQDDIHVAWDSELIAEVVLPYVKQWDITTVLTFDERGISSHPNHISLLHGAKKLSTEVNVFKLVSVSSPLEKYTSILGPLLAKYDVFAQGVNGKEASIWVYVSGFPAYFTALRAMAQHRSQLVWFRYLYVLFSRYMWVNEWVAV